MEPCNRASRRQHQATLLEEIQRLSRHERTAFVLCDLEGRSLDAVAHEVRWSFGKLARRLAGARRRLQGRMSGRGCPIPVAQLAAEFSRAEDRSLTGPLIDATVAAATRSRCRSRKLRWSTMVAGRSIRADGDNRASIDGSRRFDPAAGGRLGAPIADDRGA